MVSSFSLAVLLASAASVLLVRADVNPSTPNTANAGSTCLITWAGDTNSTTNWAGMAIELMTGNNLDMVFVTTVTTGQDGTKDGSFSWTCPQVEPFSEIYFYQFVSPLETLNPQWTTRFTIASPSGTTTAPTNTTQPDGSKISWGTGALVNAVASAPPSFASNVPAGVSIASPISVGSSTSSSSAISTASGTSAAESNTVAVTSITGSTASAAESSPDVLATGSTAASKPSATNGGLGLAVDGRVWMAASGVISSLMGLAIFL